MNLEEKWSSYMKRASKMIQVGDAYESEIRDLRVNASGGDDLIRIGYLSAERDTAYRFAKDLLDSAEVVLKQRAVELGVEVAL